MTEHARERGRACDHVALHLKRAGQFGHGDVRLGLDAPDQKGLVGGQLPAPARAPPVGRLNRPCSVRPLEKLDGATRADPKMPGRVTARMPGPHVPHDARPQIQGITLAHDRSPDHEESSIAAPVTPSRFHPQARRSSASSGCPRPPSPSPADGDRTRANQREALASVLPLERRDQLAALLTDQGSRHRATRPKNALFAGSDSGARTWAILASLINTAKLNDLDPQTYLADVLERMISGRTPVSRLDSC